MTPTARHAAFAGFCAVLMLAFHRPLLAVAAYAGAEETASHVVLVPFVSLALAYLERRRIFSTLKSAPALAATAMLAGIILLWPALPLRGDASAAASPTTIAAGTVAMVLGGFLAFYGRRAFQAALFPLLFLGLAIPFPDPVLDPIVGFLQRGSAALTGGLFELSGTPWHREGFVFSLPSLVIEVADECSGIRSSTALLLTSLVAGYLLLSETRSRVLLALAVVPLAILKNAVRIVTLSLLSIHVDPGFLTGRLHREGGFVFFLLSLALLIVTLTVLRRFERRPGPSDTGLPSRA